MSECITTDHIHNRICVFRGQRVLLQADLAGLYGVPTKQLLAHVQRHYDRFPGDFCFSLEPGEIALPGAGHASPSRRPYAFTEHGALMVAHVLGTREAVATGIQIVRAFVRLRSEPRHVQDRRQELLAVEGL